MADFLGIAREHLGMYEQGRRNLPPDASIKAAEMMMHHKKNPADHEAALKAAHDEPLKTQYIKAIKKAIFQKKKKLLKAEKELKTMQKQFKEAVHFAHYLHHHQHSDALTEGQALWHAKHKGITKRHIQMHAAPIQMLAQLEVDSLHYFIDKASSLLATLEPGQMI